MSPFPNTNPRCSPTRRHRRRSSSGDAPARTSAARPLRNGDGRSRMPSDDAHHVHGPAAQDRQRRDRIVAKGAPECGHRPVQRPVATVNGDDRGGRSVQQRGRLVQLVQRLGRQHAARIADDGLKLGCHPRVAPVGAGPRVDDDRDHSSSPASPSAPSPSSAPPAAAPAASSAASSAVSSAILGYHCSNTSAIWRACFSFEMLKDDCLR